MSNRLVSVTDWRISPTSLQLKRIIISPCYNTKLWLPQFIPHRYGWSSTHLRSLPDEIFHNYFSVKVYIPYLYPQQHRAQGCHCQTPHYYYQGSYLWRITAKVYTLRWYSKNKDPRSVSASSDISRLWRPYYTSKSDYCDCTQPSTITDLSFIKGKHLTDMAITTYIQDNRHLNHHCVSVQHKTIVNTFDYCDLSLPDHRPRQYHCHPVNHPIIVSPINNQPTLSHHKNLRLHSYNTQSQSPMETISVTS